MADDTVQTINGTSYEPPQVLASFEAGEILAQAETGSVVIIIG